MGWHRTTMCCVVQVHIIMCIVLHHDVLRGAVWCSVVQCDFACCSVLLCVAAYCSVMPCVYCSVVQCVVDGAEWCRVMQRVAVRCSVLQLLQCVTVCYIMLWCGAVCCSVLQCVTNASETTFSRLSLMCVTWLPLRMRYARIECGCLIVALSLCEQSREHTMSESCHSMRVTHSDIRYLHTLTYPKSEACRSICDVHI